MFHNVPEGSRRFQNVPECSIMFLMLENLENVPEYFRKLKRGRNLQLKFLATLV
jgi:hypothetical protein